MRGDFSAGSQPIPAAGDGPSVVEASQNLARSVLQHIDRRVTEEHYNCATSISAVRLYAEIVKSTRAGDLAPKFYPSVSSLLAFGLPCGAV